MAAADVLAVGGVILEDAKLTVTQPAQGDFEAFSSTCTHRGCTVAEVTETAVEVQGGEVVRA